MEIKPVDAITQKWARRVATASPEYQAGVESPTKDWQKNTTAAVDSWKAGIQAAIADGSFGKGVARAGNQGWQQGATGKGVQRWAPGVSESTGKYSSAFAPFVEALRRVTLPPKYARRDIRNLERVKAVAMAMQEAAKARR